MIALCVFGLLCCCQASRAEANVATNIYYVDGAATNASDRNPGTLALPWKTVQKAAGSLVAGDTVFVKAAIYHGDVRPAHSGRPDAWITYSAFPGQEHQAVIDHAGFYIEEQSCIKVTGLKIQHGSGWGIGVTGPGGNYIISGNYVYDIENSGIAVWGIAYRQDPGRFNFKAVTNVVVENNTIEQACNGGYDEQLDIANGVDGFEVRSNILKNGINSEIFNIERWAIYLEAGNATADYYQTPGLLTNLEVFNNRIHDNRGHGIGIDTEGRGNVDGIKVYNNLCYSNNGDGIIVYHHPWGKGYIKDITIFDNTVYGNGGPDGVYGGIAIDHESAMKVVVRDNLVYGNRAFQIRSWPNPSVIIDRNVTNRPPMPDSPVQPAH
ncbi:MAG: right-handed parallel beta-helix repeat-containing protein [Verrucomicrobiota bacterium]